MLIFSLLYLSLPSTAQTEPEPIDAVAVFIAAQDLHEKGNLAGAIELYEKAIKLEPAFPEAEYQRGIALLAINKTGEAERSFRRAVELRPDWTLPMISLGSLYVQLDKFADAERLLSKVHELEPLNPPALTALAELRLKTSSPVNLLKDLLSKITVLTGKANPTSSLWTAQAALENALGRRVLAKQSLAKALLIDPAFSSALLLSGEIALGEGDIEKAREILGRLDTKSPVSDSVKFLRANIFAFDGKLDEAVAELKSLPKSNRDAVELLNRINASRSTSPAELESAIATRPNDSVILGRLCGLYRRDAPARALEYCRRASESEPGNINHAIGFGAALVQAKQFDSAVILLRKITVMAPDNVTARANLATALFQLKRYPEANIEFLWLTKAQPKSAGAYLFLGIAYDQLAQYLDAMANYQQYLRLSDPVENKLDIEKVNLRLPTLQKLIKDGKGNKND